MTEPIWNVRVTVIDLIPAASADDALGKLRKRCQDRGLEIYDGDDGDAFESEPLDGHVEVGVRASWGPGGDVYGIVGRGRTPWRPWPSPPEDFATAVDLLPEDDDEIVLDYVSALGLTYTEFESLDERPGEFVVNGLVYTDQRSNWHRRLRSVRNGDNDLFDRLS